MTMYHFTECGLDNVWLVNGFEFHETAYGPAVSVPHADEILDAIAGRVVRKRGRLSGKEFRFLRVELGLSPSAMASVLGVAEQDLLGWEFEHEVPETSEAILRSCYLVCAAGDESLKFAFEGLMAIERSFHEQRKTA